MALHDGTYQTEIGHAILPLFLIQFELISFFELLLDCTQTPIHYYELEHRHTNNRIGNRKCYVILAILKYYV